MSSLNGEQSARPHLQALGPKLLKMLRSSFALPVPLCGRKCHGIWFRKNGFPRPRTQLHLRMSEHETIFGRRVLTYPSRFHISASFAGRWLSSQRTN